MLPTLSLRLAARLVLNHSTNVETLVPALEILCKKTNLLKSVVPGRISKATGSVAGLRLKLGVPTPTGFKMTARKGSSVQEVFVTTAASAEEVQKELEAILPENVVPIGASVEGSGKVKRAAPAPLMEGERS